MPDEAAFARLVREYKDMVYAVALVHGRDRTLAEDVSQEVFMKAFRSMDDMREPERIKTWLFSITRNTAIDHARRRVKAPVSLDANPVDPPAPEVDGGLPDERLAKVRTVIDTLQEDYREILVLRYIKGLSYRQIGDVLGMTVSAVGEKLCRVRKAIQAKLQTV
jgi:RNA polymerase sigma-70 factor (ECF subfamily)